MSAEGRPRNIVFLFVDGLGLGADDPETNPLAAAAMPRVRSLLGGAPTSSTPPRVAPGLVFRHLDATLGHAGLPQSATGQTALVTGRNGADIMGGHYGPWPGPTLRASLREGTLFHLAPGGAALANAYPPAWFEAMRTGQARVNVPVFAAREAGVPLRTLDDYRAGRGVPADLSGAHFARLAPGLAPMAAREAGRRLAAEGHATSFVFFDLWMTDRIGHRGTMADALRFAAALDDFVGGAIDALDGATLVLTSDHGNFEDKGRRTHTRNPVPLVAVGPRAGAFDSCGSILDVAPAVREVWGL